MKKDYILFFIFIILIFIFYFINNFLYNKISEKFENNDEIKTLVIILSETRAHELTYKNFEEKLLKPLNADLCVCIGINDNYDTNNPFYQNAKYKFTINEDDNFREHMENAFEEILNDNEEELIYKNINIFKNIKDLNNDPLIEKVDKNEINDESIQGIYVSFKKNYKNPNYAGNAYKLKNIDDIDNLSFDNDDNVKTIFKDKLHWSQFLKIKDQFLGGIKDENHQHPGSAGILIFFRWFLLKNLLENDLIEKYDRFIITRSDYIYRIEHPKNNYFDENYLYIPDGENYGGFTDRHVVLSKNNIIEYLNIFNNMVNRSFEYYLSMKHKNDWNLEQLIKFHLEKNNLIDTVKSMPYIMYSVRPKDGTTRWAKGNFDEKLGYFIKYPSEFEKSKNYENEFKNKYSNNIDSFYSDKIK